ncbi:MAG: DUF4926 domain-containing protein [Rhodothermales bacterium]
MTHRSDRVVLLRDAPKEGVWEGDVGTVVRRTDERIDVEFIDREGEAVILSLGLEDVQTVAGARLSKMIGIGIALGLLVLWLSLPLLFPGDTFYRILYTSLIAVVVVMLAVLLVWQPIRALRRRRLLRDGQEQIDPSLRAYVTSDLSWENAAMAPAPVSDALSSFRFLVDDEGFDPALIEPDAQSLHFRRREIAVNVGALLGPEGIEAGIQIVLFHSPHSYRPVAARVFGSLSDELGDGFRGAAFFLRMNLDRLIGELHEEAASAQPEYLSKRER